MARPDPPATARATYIIVGGGSAGCVLAGRLSEDPSVSVLLIEAGGDGEGFMITMPAGTYKLIGREKYDWVYPVDPDPTIDGRQQVWAGGRMLGGSSAINGLVYTRGQRGDYDLWRDSGCPGWGFDDLLPYFLRSENYQGAPSQYHGALGRLVVSPASTIHELTHGFIEACGHLGLPSREEYCAGDVDGAFYNLITSANGRRCSARDAFLTPARSRDNLQVITNCVVDRLEIREGRVQTVIATRHGENCRFEADAEVILSAGTLASPAILLRSGIGPGAELARHGIAIQHELAGVGANLQDHNGAAISKFVDVATYNQFATPLRALPHLVRYLLTRTGMMAASAVHAMAYARSKPELLEPDTVIGLGPYCIDMTGDVPTMHKHAGIMIGAHVARPRSRGHLRLRDRNPTTRPQIENRLLEDPGDREIIRTGLQFIQQLFATKGLSEHVTGNLAPEIDPVTDDEWDTYIRSQARSYYHPVGTCKMGISADSVVDPTLCVRGLSGLRVIDASIMPNITSGNTNAPTIMIGERGADLIKRARNQQSH